MRAFTSILLTLAIMATRATADCACGYIDPSTGLLWSERLITYWNETASAQADLVTNPAISPSWQGAGSAGDTGSSNQSWAVVSAPINEWEEGFSATYRTGYSPENVRLVNTTQFKGLALDVSPAILSNHSTWGSAIVSRRRDILYGSFRTMAKMPNVNYGGSAFAMHARYNQSETVDLGLYGGDYFLNKSTLHWSYSASGHLATPIVTNMTEFGTSSLDFLEHRFEWTRIPGISFSNSAGAGNFSQSKLIDGGPDHHLPTTPSTFSYRHWATGEKSESQGPPMGGTATSLVIYTRMFFNSSSPERIDAFEKQCAALSEPVCSTDDLTLRGATPFDISVSGVRYIPAEIVFKPKMWSIICLSIWLGLSLLLFSHAMARRVYEKRQKIKKFYADQAVTSRSLGPHNADNTYGNSSANLSLATSHEDLMDVRSLVAAIGESDTSSVGKDAKFEQAFQKWNYAKDSSLNGADEDEDEDDEDIRKGVWEEFDDDNELAGRYWDEALDTRHSISLVTLPVLRMDDGGACSSTSLYQASTPIIKRWKRREAPTDMLRVEDENLAEPEDGVEMLPCVKPTLGQLIRRFGSWVSKNMFVNEDNIGKTSTGQNKVAYLGSLRGFATLAVTLGHWVTMYMNLPLYATKAYDPKQAFHYPRSFMYGYQMTIAVLLGGAASFRVAMFFVLPARVLGTRYLQRGGLGNLADSSVRRIPRIIFPVFIASLLEYFLIEVSTFRWLIRLPSRTWNTWSYYQNYGNLFEFFNSFVSLWFVTPPDQPAVVTRYAIGILWTVPLMVQLTWSLFLCAIIARQISNHYKRWAFYSACLFFNWYANRFDTLFILGLTVADLDCKLNYREKAKHGLALFPALLSDRYTALKRVRLPGQIFAWIIFFVGFGFVWSEVSGIGPRFVLRELRLRPDFQTANPKGWANPDLMLTYNDLKFTCILPVLSFYLLCDLNQYFAKAFSLRIWQIIGEHSFGVFLLHGAVFWSWGSFSMINLLVVGLPYWAAHLLAFITSYALLAIVAMIFTNTVDKWGSWVSVALWRTVSRGYGRRPDQ